ncbi:DUF4177 domain-containing protein [Neobacillus sp. LXY-4]
MDEYEYVETSLGGFYSAEGWRLVQVLPMEYNGHGKPTLYEIIFEKLIRE